MAQASGSLHESPDSLSPQTVDRHRAIVSIMEELEAIDWYDQRIEGTGDAALAAVLAHNRDEEKEHAAMLLEWLRRHDTTLDAHLQRYLFTDGPIADAAASEDAPQTRDDMSLGIGALRRKEAL